ncbi:MAG TPA: polysaccharide deacetylase family protein, partial [Ktedonobacteraceae bacterium]|nr:polysaccharide deacetylase family protein [Ktedonobacteraceae bacterium]
MNSIMQHTSSATWTTWKLAFTFPADGQIVTRPGWNGAFLQSGQDRTVTNLSWNGSDAVKGSVNPDFNGIWTASNPVSTGFIVNGNNCNGTGQIIPTPLSAPWTPANIPSTLTSASVPTSIMEMVITHGNPKFPEVALTFDDGPSTYTRQVLAILQRYNARATFFSIGQNVAQFPTYLQQGLAGGNAVGNHTFTHPHLTTLSYASIYKELNDAQNAILHATGIRPTLFRPPFGEYNADVLTAAGQLGMIVVIWSAVANDWDNPQPPANVIASRILSAAGNGA